jgi:hypothetical protein
MRMWTGFVIKDGAFRHRADRLFSKEGICSTELISIGISDNYCSELTTSNNNDNCVNRLLDNSTNVRCRRALKGII